MNNVNKTLYIPLYGKAHVSQRGIILKDTKAEEIWKAEGFTLKGKAASKWLAYSMGMRSAVFDQWLREKMIQLPDAVVVHLGCGMDSRVCRVGTQDHLWLDIDFPEVIRERKRYYRETPAYQMLSFDIREEQWLASVPEERAVIVVMEGVSMYLTPAELGSLMERIGHCFRRCCLLMDCYTVFAAKASRYKNPINEVGVTQVYGLDDPTGLGLTFLREHSLTPDCLIEQLTGMEKRIFRSVFAGSFAKKLYRLYEFSS